MRELSKTRLHKILKKYRLEKERVEKEWKNFCKAKIKTTDLGNGKLSQTRPSFYDHYNHQLKKAKLFDSIMNEFEGYEVFPKESGKNTNIKQDER